MWRSTHLSLVRWRRFCFLNPCCNLVDGCRAAFSSRVAFEYWILYCTFAYCLCSLWYAGAKRLSSLPWEQTLSCDYCYAQTPLLRFVVDLLSNKFTTNKSKQWSLSISGLADIFRSSVLKVGGLLLVHCQLSRIWSLSVSCSSHIAEPGSC